MLKLQRPFHCPTEWKFFYFSLHSHFSQCFIFLDNSLISIQELALMDLYFTFMAVHFELFFFDIFWFAVFTSGHCAVVVVVVVFSLVSINLVIVVVIVVVVARSFMWTFDFLMTFKYLPNGVWYRKTTSASQQKQTLVELCIVRKRKIRMSLIRTQTYNQSACLLSMLCRLKYKTQWLN